MDAKILILGFSFKENCPDIRNSRVADLVHSFQAFNLGVDVYDPRASVADIQKEYQISALSSLPERTTYDAVVVAVAHDEFKEWGVGSVRSLCGDRGILFDVKGIFDKSKVDLRL